MFFVLFCFSSQNWRWVDCISRVSLVGIVHMEMLFSLQLYLYLLTTFSAMVQIFLSASGLPGTVASCNTLFQLWYRPSEIPDWTSRLNDIENEALNITTW